MSKVSVIGAGNVGATCANVLAFREIADEVVLLDIKEGVSEGKAMDMMQAAVTAGFASRIKGVTNNYEATANSDMVVITSGIPRKPGMTREELIGVNAGIVKSVVENVLKYSPNAVILCVSNPMDTMTYLIHKVSGLPKNRIIGMGGALDSSRFKYYLSQALGQLSFQILSEPSVECQSVGGRRFRNRRSRRHDYDSCYSFRYLQGYSRYRIPERRGFAKSRCRHDGGWRYIDRIAGNVGMVCSGCCCRFGGRGRIGRPETHGSLQRFAGRRVRGERPLHRRTLCIG